MPSQAFLRRTAPTPAPSPPDGLNLNREKNRPFITQGLFGIAKLLRQPFPPGREHSAIAAARSKHREGQSGLSWRWDSDRSRGRKPQGGFPRHGLRSGNPIPGETRVQPEQYVQRRGSPQGALRFRMFQSRVGKQGNFYAGARSGNRVRLPAASAKIEDISEYGLSRRPAAGAATADGERMTTAEGQ